MKTVNILGFDYIILFNFNKYIAFVRLSTGTNNEEIIDLDTILHLTKKSRYNLNDLAHKEFLNYFYKDNPPERELLENRGISVTVKLSKSPQLLLSYIYNGDNTKADVIGFACLGENPKNITMQEFLKGVVDVARRNLNKVNNGIVSLEYYTEVIY